ncbi:MAG: hypothetical protein AB3N14_03940 [Flavobacteriaceae bacterium]
MESKKYLDDISEIKTMMSRSSRFISLSGLSGILAGIYALIGAVLAHFRITAFNSYDYTESTGIALGRYQNHLVRDLGFIAIAVIALAIITAVVLSSRKAKKSGEKLWNVSSKRLVINFFIPLVAGGIFCMVLLQYGILGLVSPATLIFYGLACVNASKYTLGDVRYLGITNIILGLVATQFIGYGLYFWAVGFGLLHIIYGASMYYKYDRKEN